MFNRIFCPQRMVSFEVCLHREIIAPMKSKTLKVFCTFRVFISRAVGLEDYLFFNFACAVVATAHAAIFESQLGHFLGVIDIAAIEDHGLLHHLE